jgi:tyrosyl-DNA phosphodiesterase 2
MQTDISSFIFHQPERQPYYSFDSGSWTAVQPSSASQTTQISKKLHLSSLRLFSWNIDILIPFTEPRMFAALNYLSTLVSTVPVSQPIVIFLQEMGISDLTQIQAAPWIRERFYITDTSSAFFGNEFYGTTTLVDRRLKIVNVFRVPFESKFERDGFFVDLQLDGSSQVLRLCNVHLESLVADPPLRPKQLALAAEYMHQDVVYASVLAGDCNAIQPFDRTLHTDNGLRDAYLELGGQEDSEDGYTWGYQVPEKLSKKFGPSRMDKVMFCGNMTIKNLQRIGIGIKVEDEQTRKEMVDAGQVEFVTDHYGLMAEMDIVGAAVASLEEAVDGQSLTATS